MAPVCRGLPAAWAGLHFLGRHPEAIEAFKNAVDYSGHNPSMKAWLAYGLAVAGRKTEGEGTRAELEDLSKRAHVRALLLALASAGFGRKEETMAALHRAYEEHDFWMQWLAIDAAFDFLHEESDFQELLRKVGSSRKKVTAAAQHGLLLSQAQPRQVAPGNCC